MPYNFMEPRKLREISVHAAILAYLWQRADGTGRTAASMGDIAKGIDASREVVNRAIQQMQERRQIMVDESRRCNVYTIPDLQRSHRGASDVADCSPSLMVHTSPAAIAGTLGIAARGGTAEPRGMTVPQSPIIPVM